MNISLNIANTTIHSVAEYISNIIKNRLVSSDCTVEAFESGIDEKREDIDLIVEFNNVPVFIENSPIKFLHLSFEMGYNGVEWDSEPNVSPTYNGDCEYDVGLFENNILWSTGELDGNGDHIEPIQLLTENLDFDLSGHIMGEVLNNLTEIELHEFKQNVWNKYFSPTVD